MSKYRIRTLKGADYIVTVGLKAEISDSNYKVTAPEAEKDYGFCGSMRRDSAKYEGVESWSMDSRFCSRKGGWENNLYTDYEYLYESMVGMLSENAANFILKYRKQWYILCVNIKKKVGSICRHR